MSVDIESAICYRLASKSTSCDNYRNVSSSVEYSSSIPFRPISSVSTVSTTSGSSNRSVDQRVEPTVDVINFENDLSALLSLHYRALTTSALAAVNQQSIENSTLQNTTDKNHMTKLIHKISEKGENVEFIFQNTDKLLLPVAVIF